MLVRDDIPAGAAAAQLVHAAGESSPGNLPCDTFAVVLAVPSAGDLEALAERLVTLGVRHVLIREPDAPWCGEAMALGLAPVDRETVRVVLKHLRLYKGPRTC